MKPIVYLHHWTGKGPVVMTEGETPRTHILPLYSLEQVCLDDYSSILIPAHVDQRYLLTQQQRLEAFVDGGGTIVMNGHVAYPFLRWLTPFEPVAYRGIDSLRIYPQTSHPVFEGVDYQDMMFRRGVAGFYARGANPVHPDAVVINTLGQDRLPVDWMLTLPQGGRLFVHSGNDIWMFHGSDDSTARIVPQLFAWLNREVR